MSDLADGALDMTTVPNARKHLASEARALANSNPASAVSSFRAVIKPYFEAGRAWLVEPAVRVLITELRRNPTAGPNAIAEAEQLLEEADDATGNAVDLAIASTTDAANISATPTIEDALLHRDVKPSVIVEDPQHWKSLERVRLKCVYLDDKVIDTETWETLLLGPAHRLTLLGSGPQDMIFEFSEPRRRAASRRSVAVIFMRRLLGLFDHDHAAHRAMEVRRRVMGAMLTMSTDDAIVTVQRGQSPLAYTDFYRCELNEKMLERIRDRAIRIVKVDVKRPAMQQPTDALIGLASELAALPAALPALNNGIGVYGVDVA